MATSTKTEAEKPAQDMTEEAVGEVSKEKVVPAPELGGSFTFRLPFALDHFQVLRRRAEIVGIPEALAGVELLGSAHALAMFETFCTHEAVKLDLSTAGPEIIDPFMKMMEEVRDWHETFRNRVGRKKV
jgi:hypothetical protein